MIIILLFKLLWEMELLWTKFKCMFFWTGENNPPRTLLSQRLDASKVWRHVTAHKDLVSYLVYLPVKQTKT